MPAAGARRGPASTGTAASGPRSIIPPSLSGKRVPRPPLLPALLLVALALGPVARAAPPPPPGPVLLDRVVAVVGDRIITASDVALERELAQRDPSPVAVIQERRREPLEALIDLAIARSLAGDVSLYQPTQSQVRERMGAVRGSWVDPREWEAFLDRTGHSEEQLAGALYSRIIAERYVLRNVTSRAEGRASDREEGLDAARRAYARWIADQRQRVLIRVVPPLDEAAQ